MPARRVEDAMQGHFVQPARDSGSSDDPTGRSHAATAIQILLRYLEDAFLGWREHSVGAMAGQDALSLHIMLSAARLSAGPLAKDALETVLSRAP